MQKGEGRKREPAKIKTVKVPPHGTALKTYGCEGKEPGEPWAEKRE